MDAFLTELVSLFVVCIRFIVKAFRITFNIINMIFLPAILIPWGVLIGNTFLLILGIFVAILIAVAFVFWLIDGDKDDSMTAPEAKVAYYVGYSIANYGFFFDLLYNFYNIKADSVFLFWVNGLASFLRNSLSASFGIAMTLVSVIYLILVVIESIDIYDKALSQIEKKKQSNQAKAPSNSYTY